MTLPCSTLTLFWAARFWRRRGLPAWLRPGLAGLGWLAVCASALAQPQQPAGGRHGAGHVAVVMAGRDSEVVLVPTAEVPTFGPAVAPLTLDLFLPFGHRSTGPELGRYLQLAADHDDIRLRLHPVLGSDVAERGAELSLFAWELVGPDCAPFLLDVAEHPEWLIDWPAQLGWALSDASSQLGNERRRDGDLQLFAAAGRQGIDVEKLRQALRERRQRSRATQLWTRMRSAVRTPPEIWLNGRRLRSPVSESVLREELERQRRRAYQLLRAGIPLSGLYEELLAGAESSDAPSPYSSPASSPLLSGRMMSPRSGSAPAPALPARRSRPEAASTSRIDLSDVPLRGPKVSPVSVVLIGNLESGPTCELARELREVLRPYAEAVRFAYLPAPNGALLTSTGSTTAGASYLFSERTQRVPLLLAALAQENGAAFFRTYDAIIDLMRRRFLLTYVEFAQSIASQRLDFDRLEVQSRQAPARQLVSRAQRDAQRLGATSLPALFINGRIVPGIGSISGPGSGTTATRAEQMTRLIESELRRGLLDRLGSQRR